MIYKHGASISAAEVGCQGEVGVACSMAAAAVCHVQGGTPAQIEDAVSWLRVSCVFAAFLTRALRAQAEVGMEHNIGLSCDPIGGLVQIPCIERNVMGAAKAVASARLALLEEGKGMVSLDEIVKTMLETGLEMSTKLRFVVCVAYRIEEELVAVAQVFFVGRYKETSRGGLATHTRIAANVTEC